MPSSPPLCAAERSRCNPPLSVGVEEHAPEGATEKVPDTNGVEIGPSPSLSVLLMPSDQPEGREIAAHGVSRGITAADPASPVRGGRSPRDGDLLPSSGVSYAPEGAARGWHRHPTAYAVGYASSARKRAEHALCPRYSFLRYSFLTPFLD